jgi:hypothetical protein
VASYFRRSKEFGITHDGFTIDMADVRERKRRMVRGLNDMYFVRPGLTFFGCRLTDLPEK